MVKLFFFSILAFSFGVGIFFVEQLFFTDRVTLAEVALGSLADTKGKYGIVIKDIKTGDTYTQNQDEIFDTASLYKLWVMAETFAQMKEGVIKEEDILSADIPALHKEFNIDPENAEFVDGHVEMTVSEALEQMITISHNYAALLLSQKLKNSEIASFLEADGFIQSSLGGTTSVPQSTPSDIALFYEKLYKGEIVDKESSEKMIEILKRQKRNNGIPKYLPPKNATVGHKTGELGWLKHDAGIVFAKKGDYIIVVMSESDSPLGAEEKIAKLSEAVYKYFQTKKNFWFSY